MDQILRQLEEQIAQGNTDAVIAYLRRLEQASRIKTSDWHRFLQFWVIELFAEDGFSFFGLTALRNFLLAIYDVETANKIIGFCKSADGLFFFSNESFGAICQLLNLRYICNVCQSQLFDVSEIQICFLCDQLYCNNCHHPGMSQECITCHNKELVKSNQAICDDCHQRVPATQLVNRSNCSVEICQSCLANIDPISLVELSPENRHLCDDCYYTAFCRNMEAQGRCNGCMHPAHGEVECFCGCVV